MSLLDRLRGQRVESVVAESESGESDIVEGERGVSAAQRPLSLQSRLTNLLALGLMGAIAAGMLGWYYLHWIHGRTAAQASAQSTAQDKAKGEINLRPLGRVDPPSPIANLLGESPQEPPPENPDVSLRPSSKGFAPAAYMPISGNSAKRPQELLQERRLSGRAFSTGDHQLAAATGAAAGTETMVAERQQQTGDAEWGAL